MSISTFNTCLSWGLSPLPGKELFCIAGPCAAESLQQVTSCAAALHPLGISAFRAGVWKPRTRPGAFEGFGAPALEWLQEAKKQTGALLAIEVATPAHVELALNAGIDILWIGARTSASPIIVQELANAMKGCGNIVLVKNPVNPDFNLWIGAVERILSCGITRCGSILRGFSTSHPGDLRNEPGWHLAIDFRQKMPEIPLFCDPSHIAGRRDKLAALAQQALNLDFDGLFIEVHPTPELALSDARQQLTPGDFRLLLDSLTVRQRGSGSAEDMRMNALRAQIDELDYEILSAIARRMAAAQELGRIKRSGNLTVLQPDRWNQVLAGMLELGSSLKLPPAMVEDIAKILHRQAIRLQQDMLEGGKD